MAERSAPKAKVASIQEAAKSKKKTRKRAKTAPKKYVANLYCPSGPLPEKFVDAVQRLEASLDRRVWLLVQNTSVSSDPVDVLGFPLLTKVFEQRNRLPTKPIAVLVDSPGGDAHATYQIARAFRRRCGGFAAVIPKYAKSAATLLVLGADEIILGPYAQLGPIDVQIQESARKPPQSALNEKQTLDRLHSQAIEAVDQSALFLMRRLALSLHEMEEFMPMVMENIAKEFAPLYSKVDVVHWTFMSRLLKIAEDYAFRLLRPRFTETQARQIARTLVEAYSDHGSVIDCEEARRIGLKITEPVDDQAKIVDDLFDVVDGVSAMGFLEEFKES